MRDEDGKLKTSVQEGNPLMKRAHDLTSDQHLLKDELHCVEGVLKCNGYPKGFVKKYN